MATIQSALFDISYMDTLSCGDTPIHKLDPGLSS